MTSSPPCRCRQPPFDFKDFVRKDIGVDTNRGRFGDVAVERCVHCGSLWLTYQVAYEAFTASGRWFRGPIAEDVAARIRPDEAIPFLERLEAYFQGGSYFKSSGEISSGPVRAE